MDNERKIIRIQIANKTNIQKNTLLLRKLKVVSKQPVVQVQKTASKVVPKIASKAIKQFPSIQIQNASVQNVKNTSQRTPYVINRTKSYPTPRNALKEQVLKDVSYNKIIALKNTGADKVLVMIGCGPSVNEVDFSPLLNNLKIDFMVINKPYHKVWPAKYWAFCDHSQYERNIEEFNSYTGIIINSIAVKARAHRATQVIVNVSSSKGVSYDLTRGYVIGRSSVYANIQTAIWLGYAKVFIFGCDMNPNGINGQLHHYGINPDVPPENRKTRFKAEAEHYDEMAAVLPEHLRKRFYFCSSYNEWPFVHEFNKLDHKKSVEFIISIL